MCYNSAVTCFCKIHTISSYSGFIICPYTYYTMQIVCAIISFCLQVYLSNHHQSFLINDWLWRKYIIIEQNSNFLIVYNVDIFSCFYDYFHTIFRFLSFWILIRRAALNELLYLITTQILLCGNYDCVHPMKKEYST